MMRFLYRYALKPVLFQLEPERVHDSFVHLGARLGQTHHGRNLIARAYGYHGEDALAKFRAGADLVQLISGMIFEGPHLMKDIATAHAEHKHMLTPAHVPRIMDKEAS